MSLGYKTFSQEHYIIAAIQQAASETCSPLLAMVPYSSLGWQIAGT